MPVLPSDLVIPNRHDVLGQAIPFDRERWLRHLPDTTWWPEELDACPRTGRWHRVDRHTVFDMADRAGTALGRRHLLVASLVWGSGTKARSVDRRGSIFAKSSADGIDARLAAVVSRLEREGAVAAYLACKNDERIPYLGPAFFTKFLYFAGHDYPTDSRRPLILDSVVSRGLRDQNTIAKRWPLNGWSEQQYARYLDLLHEQADSAAVMPDVMEAAWFAYGRRTPLRRHGPASDRPATPTDSPPKG
ncbi:UNVERIFIED_CONTAM: hypothetical protein RKD43_006104 [Streptomyces graminofaciens]